MRERKKTFATATLFEGINWTIKNKMKSKEMMTTEILVSDCSSDTSTWK
jgi:hypothetical protein